MFNSVALDVVIGLVFVYLLYSLLGTLIEEIIATNIGLRGIVLQKAIRRMLDDDKVNQKAASKALLMHIKNVDHLLRDKGLSDERRDKLERKLSHLKVTQDFIDEENQSTSPKLSAVFYSHPLIKYLSADTWILKKRPSYIDPETFSKVVIDLLRGQNQTAGSSDRQPIQNSLSSGEIAWETGVPIERETLIYLKSIWADAQGDVTKFTANLEEWFNEMMNRTTGWYKKYTQIILMAVGVVVAVAFNVDTIQIVEKLQKDPKLREQIIAQATDFTKAHPNLDKDLAETQSKLQSLGKPANKDDKLKKDSLNILSAQNRKSKEFSDSLYKAANNLVETDLKKADNILALGWKGDFWDNFHNIKPINLAGWILTALAISMGAPFWFDLLNKLMQLRSSVASKDDATSKANASTNATPSTTKRVG